MTFKANVIDKTTAWIIIKIIDYIEGNLLAKRIDHPVGEAAEG